VKQHLEELRGIGIVQFVEDTHLHRCKYYELVPFMTLRRCGFSESGRRIAQPMVAR
jgi:hypothetical protein